MAATTTNKKTSASRPARTVPATRSSTPDGPGAQDATARFSPTRALGINDRDQLRSAIITWVESTYNHRRRKRALGKPTPAEFEALIGYNTLAVAA